MIEFTKEFISFHRLCLRENTAKFVWSAELALDALDHIEHLQARVQELEEERRWIHQDKTMIVKKDGDSWCAVLPGFKDLQQSESRWFSGDINKYIDDVYWYLNDEPQPPQEGE